MSDDRSDPDKDSSGNVLRDLSEWAGSLRRTGRELVSVGNDWFRRRGALTRTLVSVGLAALAAQAVESGTGSLVPIPSLAPVVVVQFTLIVIAGILAGGVLVLARGFNRVERVVATRMDHSRPRTDGGTDHQR